MYKHAYGNWETRSDYTMYLFSNTYSYIEIDLLNNLVFLQFLQNIGIWEAYK